MDRPAHGPFRPGSFTSSARSERTTAVLGIALGALFGVCFITGILSHLIQQPPGWFAWPSRPVWLYQWSQGLHVFSGIAAIPVLLAKLWSVYPNLYRWPPVRGVAHAIERAAAVPLVGGALLLLATGLMNIGYWYGCNQRPAGCVQVGEEGRWRATTSSCRRPCPPLTWSTTWPAGSPRTGPTPRTWSRTPTCGPGRHGRTGTGPDTQTASTWDPFGRAVAGPLTGARLAPATAMDSFWFDWAAFHPDTPIWTG
jgi:Protein of unknown function (DUF3179)